MPIELDLLLLGTGTSSSIPLIQCLTDPDTGCHCCRSTLPSYLDAQERTDEEREMGRRNKRRNTSGMLRIKQEGGGEKTVLIDVRFTPSFSLFLVHELCFFPFSLVQN